MQQICVKKLLLKNVLKNAPKIDTNINVKNVLVKQLNKIFEKF